MVNKEELEKRILYLIASVFFMIFLIYLYENEKWSVNKKRVKEEIRDNDILYVYEYKYFSFKEMKWLYRVSTPTSTSKHYYYEWDKETNELKKVTNY